MKRLVSPLVLCLAFTSSAALGGEAWRYRFEPGKRYGYTFSSESVSSVNAPMLGGLPGGMAGDAKGRVTIQTDYRLFVRRQEPDGRYDVQIEFTRLSIDDGRSGRKVTLQTLPPAARTAHAKLSARGRFEFYERTVLESKDGAYALAKISTKDGALRSEARASDGNEEHSLVATIDMKTGKAHASVKKKAAVPKTAPAAPAERRELLPLEVLALMELPEGPLRPGQREDVSLGGLDASTVVETSKGCKSPPCLVLRLSAKSKIETGKATMAGAAMADADQRAFNTDDDEGATEPAADPAAPAAMPELGGMEMGGMPGMPAMPGMPGMERPGAPGNATAAAAISANDGLQMKLDAKLSFDAQAGNLLAVEGVSSTRSVVAGVEMNDDSTFTLRSVPAVK